MENQKTEIELLSPAKDLSCGIAAIEHGADAVYIGGPSFGARANASNSVDEIEKLVTHAHTFHAKVYTTLNTLLFDHEIEQAEKLIWQLYDAGVDALIVQDLGILECNLPPIQLHASTQLNNRTVEKVKFLEQVGFTQVVLARELNLKQIRDIHNNTSVPLEFFIHGALCVSYSGLCYISQLMTGRSANRGSCAQFCRHTYSLTDGSGKKIGTDSHFLSLQDLNLSAHLQELMDAGVRSFKIEGRLKNEEYVKNVTAYYRQKLNTLLESSSTYCQSSSGTCSFSFTPDPEKTFHRGGTSYYLNNLRNKPGQLNTPKSSGKLLGKVISSSAKGFSIKTGETIHNGDGLCYFDSSDSLIGLRVNRIENGLIQTRERVHPPKDVIIYRNNDTQFIKTLRNSEGCRKINITLTLKGNCQHLFADVVDEDGLTSTIKLTGPFDPAKNSNRMLETIQKQLTKTGDTTFTAASVKLELDEIPFLPASTLNGMRRDLLALHHQQRLSRYERQQSSIEKNTVPWPATTTSPMDNITNQKAKDFYRRHGVEEFSTSPDIKGFSEELDLMTTKYCIRYQLNLCPHNRKDKTIQYKEPFFIQDKTGRYQLFFDCDVCQMRVRLAK